MSTNLDVQRYLKIQELNQNNSRTTCLHTYGEDVVKTFLTPVDGKNCPPFWDDITCWPDTPAGMTAVQACAKWMHGFLPERNATRKCMENGVWYMRENNETWSNYTRCYDARISTVLFNGTHYSNISEIFKTYVPIAKSIASKGYMVSFCTLIIALAIMLSIKKLHCARNILHMHLFASFLLRASTFLLTDYLLLDSIGLPSDFFLGYFNIDTETNNWECKLMTSLLEYFLTANYIWILMEGLYLHNLIFRAMFVDSCTSIKWYVVMGWGLPLVIISLWVPAKYHWEDSICWRTHEDDRVFMIIAVPIMASIIVNFVLFIRISMVLYSKLRSPITDDNQMRYRKWVKSTLVLVPLFGVHYALIMVLYFIDINDTVRVCWLITDIFFGSFQGAIVAVLYCFLNGEVKTEVAPKIYPLFAFLATNKYSKPLFPFRKRFLKTVVGRTSVCTTMSCSSLCTNGVLHRNSKARLDTKKAEHACQTNGVKPNRKNSESQCEATLSIECQTIKCCEDETHHKIILENNF